MSQEQSDNLEALLAAAKSPGEIEMEKDLHEVDRFIIHFGIMPGPDRIMQHHIWKLYNTWYHGKPLARQTFFVHFKKKFRYHKALTYKYFKLNAEPFDSLDPSFKTDRIRAHEIDINAQKEKREKTKKNQTEAV